MNRIKTLLALTGAIGLFAALPASQAIANHVPGATYTGTHDQGGSFSFTLTGDLCAAAKKKVKKLKKQLKNADSASAKKKISKKLKLAKSRKQSECVGFTNEPGVPTGERVISLTIGGPVTGQETVSPGGPCPLIGPGSQVSLTPLEFPPQVRDVDGRHTFFLNPTPAELSPYGFTFLAANGIFPGPSLASSLQPLVITKVLRDYPRPRNFCETRLSWDAQQS